MLPAVRAFARTGGSFFTRWCVMADRVVVSRIQPIARARPQYTLESKEMSPRLSPCKRMDFVSCLRLLGFDGPYPGTRHAFMLYQEYRQTIPSYDEYDPEMLSELLKQVGEVLGRRISREEWANLKRGRASTENP